MHESRMQYRNLVEGTPDLITRIDSEGRLLFVNHSALEIYGLKPEACIGRSAFDFIHPDDRSGTVAAFQYSLKSGVEIFTHENRLVGISGQVHHMAWTIRIERDEAGNFCGFAGTAKDSTKFKQTEEALRQSKRELSTLMDNLPGMVFFCLNDQDWTMKFISEGSFSLTGYLPDELIDNKLLSYCKIIYPDDGPMVWSTIQESIKNKSAYDIEYRIVKKDGTVKYVRERGQGIFATDDSLHHLEGFITDITESKQAEEALKKSQLLLLSSLESQKDTILLAVDRDYRYLYFNKAHSEVMKSAYNKDIKLGMNILDCITSAEDRKADLDNYTRALNGESHSVTRIYGDLERSSYECFFNPVVNDKNEIIGAAALAIDITERKRTENALRESEAKYSSLFNSMLEGFALHEIICDTSGKPVDYRFLDMNPAFEKLTGLKKADAVGQTVLTVFPETEQYWIENYGTVALTGDPISFEHYSSALKRYYRVVAFSPQKKQFAVLFDDITERKMTEAALIKSETRFRTMIDVSPVPMALNDDQQKVTFLNQAFIQIFGYTEKDIPTLERWWTEAYPDPAYRRWVAEAWQAELARTKQTGTAFSPIEVIIRCKNRTNKTVLASAALFSNSSEGNHLVVLYDITERKQAEEALQAKTALLEAQSNASNNGILVIDENNKRVLYNRRIVELFNAPPHIMADEDDAALLKYVSSLIKAPGQFLDKITYLNSHVSETSRDEIEFKSGMVLDRYSAPVMGKDGKYYGRIWTFNDITELKRMDSYKNMGWRILTILNETGNIQDSIQRVLAVLKEYTGFDAVGIRLKEGDDFPYFTQEGFSSDFLIKENSLIERSQSGGVCRDANGDISLECTCGLVISGKTDASNPLFTRGGSCWTNNSFPILDIPAGQDTRLHPRNECIHHGYASVALIPIRNKDEIVGLVQFNDRRKDCFTLDIIEILEGIASHIGNALMRKQAKEAMAQSEARFRSYFELPLTGRAITSPQKGWMEVNATLCDMLGYTKAELMQMTWTELTHPDDLALDLTQFNRLLNDEIDGYMLDKRFIHKDGHSVFTHMAVQCLRHPDRSVDYLVSIIIDISELKRTEEELIKAKEKAQERDRLKSAFLANMSHEIRTPMNGILGFTGLLKEPRLTGEEQQQYIKIIEQSGDRMLNTINDIINISKIESGQMEISLSGTNVNEQIEYIYSFFKPEVEQKGLQISFKNALPAKEVFIKTDKEKIYGILTNLVNNAIKFTFTGSIELGYEKKGEFLEFYVKDSGIAIPKERQEAIFDRFVQAHAGNRRAFQGAGLGLSISKAYVEMLGGKIRVESEEGKGSVFYFTIPYNPQAENNYDKDIPANEEEIQIKPLKILIAEDDEKSELLIAITVKRLGEVILKAGTGFEAVEICRNNPDIDLVLMDIEMPGMDGYEATRQIRKFNKNAVIIAQTAYALAGEKEKAIAAGCNDYIAKPFKQTSLMALLKKYF
ncbi:MAG: PAS domain S-box protein [Lentisphaerota bacterium]